MILSKRGKNTTVTNGKQVSRVALTANCIYRMMLAHLYSGNIKNLIEEKIHLIIGFAANGSAENAISLQVKS